MTEEGSYKPTPIFDNGKSLLNCNQSGNRNLPIEENVKRVVARPLSGSHKVMYEHFGNGFELDIEKALEWLKTEPDSFYKKVLVFRLNTVIY